MLHEPCMRHVAAGPFQHADKPLVHLLHSLRCWSYRPHCFDML